MTTSATRQLLLGATAGVIAVAAAAVAASAKGNHHHRFRTYGPIVVTSGLVGCDAYYWKWKRTGARFWRSKYFACIG